MASVAEPVDQWPGSLRSAGHAWAWPLPAGATPSCARDDDVKTDRTQQWIALGQTAADDVIGPPGDSTENPWSLYCVAPVVGLIRASHPRVFALSGPAGAGKSTVASAVSRSLANVGMRAVVLSLDDFYLSRRERERRGTAWRAAPGSHDIDLMVQ